MVFGSSYALFKNINPYTRSVFHKLEIKLETIISLVVIRSIQRIKNNVVIRRHWLWNKLKLTKVFCRNATIGKKNASLIFKDRYVSDI